MEKELIETALFNSLLLDTAFVFTTLAYAVEGRLIMVAISISAIITTTIDCVQFYNLLN